MSQPETSTPLVGADARFATGLLALALSACPAVAQDTSQDREAGWFARAWGGYSSLSDTGGAFDNTTAGPPVDSVDVSADGGFTAGAGFGYRYAPRLAVELAWEYRSNGSETTFAAGPGFDDGNYASNTFFLNGYYYLDKRGPWEPYLGAGLSWIQEIDIDLEGNGPEQSYAGDGDVGFQVFVGSNYRLNERWSAHGELRYSSVTGVDLEGEGISGRFSDFDYEPLTFQLGLSYSF
ncbi:MAG: OmpW family outer membrane protein [Pseudomonadota bacterium]